MASVEGTLLLNRSSWMQEESNVGFWSKCLCENSPVDHHVVEADVKGREREHELHTAPTPAGRRPLTNNSLRLSVMMLCLFQIRRMNMVYHALLTMAQMKRSAT